MIPECTLQEHLGLDRKKSNLPNSTPCVFASTRLAYWFVLQCQDPGRDDKSEKNVEDKTLSFGNYRVKVVRETRHKE